MSYVSPLHIIKGITNDAAFEINDDNLIRLRKRLLAELNLSGETTITINKKAYSKDEIIKTIDQLLGSADLDLHDFIFTHTFLLRYLEEESMMLNPDAYQKIDPPEALKSRLEPILCDRVILQFKKGISSRAFTHAQNALSIITTFPDDLKNEGYEEIHKSLSTLQTFLYELENSLTLGHKNEIKFLGFESFAVFLNALPPEFEGIKYDLVNRAINIVVTYHKMGRHDRDLVEDISTVLTKVNCSDEQEALIKSNHKVFTSKRSGSSSSSSGSSEYAYLRYIGIAAVILFNIFRVCTKTNSYDYSNSSNYNVLNEMAKYSNHTAKASGLAEELRLYRGAISERSKKDANSLMNFVLFDTLRDVGKNPFQNGFKAMDDSTFSLWKKELLIQNTTDHDLIVLCFDSAKTAISKTFIRQHEQDTLLFNNHVRLIFYFGNTLMRAKEYAQIGPDVPGYYECFLETDAWQIRVLNITYELILKQPKNKKKSGYTLTLDPAFIETPLDTIKLKKFELVNVYE